MARTNVATLAILILASAVPVAGCRRESHALDNTVPHESRWDSWGTSLTAFSHETESFGTLCKGKLNPTPSAATLWRRPGFSTSGQTLRSNCIYAASGWKEWQGLRVLRNGRGCGTLSWLFILNMINTKQSVDGISRWCWFSPSKADALHL